MIGFLNTDTFFETLKKHNISRVNIYGSVAKAECYELHSSYSEKKLRKMVKKVLTNNQ